MPRVRHPFLQFVIVFLCVAATVGTVAWSATGQSAPAPSGIGQPARPTEACLRLSVAVVVDLNNETMKETIAHERAAIESGSPRVLHLDRANADAHRARALRSHPARRGFDRDEYPPAVSVEGGADSDVAYIDPTDNRRSGQLMGAQLHPFCDGQAFIIEP